MKKQNYSAVLNGKNRHIVLFGKFGSGKTSIFECLVGDVTVKMGNSKFSPIMGICKLGREGEATIIDTADLNGAVELDNDSEAIRRTFNLIRRADIAIYVVDLQEFDREAYQHDHDWLEENNIPYLLAFNHCDEAYIGEIARIKLEFPDAVFISTQTPGSISVLRARLSQMIRTIEMNEAPLVPKGFIEPGDYVVMLVSQSNGHQIRDEHELLDELIHCGARCVIAEEREMTKVLEELPHVDLVISSARSFEMIRDLLPEDIRLTSYSLLYGYQSGELDAFADGARAIEGLNNDSRVLIAENSINHTAHSDIGHVKIPRALRRIAGEGLQIDYCVGLDLPDNLNEYALVIDDSSGAMTQRLVQARVDICREAGVPIANYGTVLAQLAGVLERCQNVLK